MDFTTRREVYLRGRSELTPAQRRRLRKALNRQMHAPVVRASRLRKAHERARRRELRWEGLSLMYAMRGGNLRQSAQRAAKFGRTISEMRRALAAQDKTKA